MKYFIIILIVILHVPFNGIAQGDTSTPMAYNHSKTKQELINPIQRTEDSSHFVEMKKTFHSKNFIVKDAIEAFYAAPNINYGVFKVSTTLKEPLPITVTIKDDKGNIIATQKSDGAVWTFEPMFNIRKQTAGTYFIQLTLKDAIVMQRFVIKK